MSRVDQVVTEAGGIALRYGGFYGAPNHGLVEPVLANALGAKPPRHFPRWLARLVAGEGAVIMGT